jgi:hypothetical protein
MYHKNGFSRIFGGAVVFFCTLMLMGSLIVAPATMADGLGGGPNPPITVNGGEDSTGSGQSLTPETLPEIPVEVEILLLIVSVTV